MHGANAAAVIFRLNPVIPGMVGLLPERGLWPSVHRLGPPRLVWHLTYRWARRSHPNKSRGWVAARHFGQFNKSRQDRWVFGDRDSGAYLTKFAWTKIVRHVPVHGGASPDDPALSEYWANRQRKKKTPPIDRHTDRLLRRQGGRCHVCGELLLHAEHEPRSPRMGKMVHDRPACAGQQHIVERIDGQDQTIYRLLHASCRPRNPAGTAAVQP
jgi:RNA-directed DNA polymerase